jgi:hypothetical protein
MHGYLRTDQGAQAHHFAGQVEILSFAAEEPEAGLQIVGQAIARDAPGGQAFQQPHHGLLGHTAVGMAED